MIELYQQAPAACLEYDPLVPRAAWLVSELILSGSAALGNPEANTGPADGSSTVPDAAEVPGDTTTPNRLNLAIEHIGSTAVPGCAGKGIIDLMLLYDEGGLEHAKRVLDSLGFQRQRTRDPFPESRPMRLGAVNYQGKQYRLHVHVIAATSPEASVLRGFRDALIRDQGLRSSYVDRKRAIIAAGVVDSLDYSEAKTEFISKAIEQTLPGDAFLVESTINSDQ